MEVKMMLLASLLQIRSVVLKEEVATHTAAVLAAVDACVLRWLQFLDG